MFKIIPFQKEYRDDDNDEAPHFYFARGFCEVVRSEDLRHLVKILSRPGGING
ncbi:MAG: hypothetical protein FWD23_17310 [Oscillospiraceae bacterium]|nr:hypothetical protein [Oscillospiraceae bacterium]